MNVGSRIFSCHQNQRWESSQSSSRTFAKKGARMVLAECRNEKIGGCASFQQRRNHCSCFEALTKPFLPLCTLSEGISGTLSMSQINRSAALAIRRFAYML